jgi:murein DD-endopeptidase MepM/ murein hydrolase activator NlpD
MACANGNNTPTVTVATDTLVIYNSPRPTDTNLPPTITPTPTNTPPVFGIPAYGFMGKLGYMETYSDSGNPHTGIDIWQEKGGYYSMPNGTVTLAPVYAVYEGTAMLVYDYVNGKQAKTPKAVKIIHPKIDETAYPGLPHYEVCTYYGHLRNIPTDALEFEGINASVEKGEIIGYMNFDPTSSSVHLHFSITYQDTPGNCTSELTPTNALDPFVYLGLDQSDYPPLTPFPIISSAMVIIIIFWAKKKKLE